MHCPAHGGTSLKRCPQCDYKPVSHDPPRPRQIMNPEWCLGCDPDNCPGCGPYGVEYEQALDIKNAIIKCIIDSKSRL